MDRQALSAEQLRAYATGTLGWSALRKLDVNYANVLAGLGELGLRPPMAPMGGPNLEGRKRGVRALRQLLAQPHP